MMKSYLLLIISIFLFLACEDKKEEDTTPPTVIITSTFAGWVSEIVPITVMVNDDSGVEKVELWVDGISTGITDNSEPYELDWNTVTYENGTAHVIVIRAYDTSGNISDSVPITLTVDNSSAVPAAVDVTVQFSNDSFIITWTKNTDVDFSSYTLYESESDDQSSGNLIYQTENRDDTTYTVSGISPGAVQYYWVTVEDTLTLKNNSNVSVAMTHLFVANFTNDWLCAECGEGIIFISDMGGNVLAEATWTGNASIVIEVPEDLTEFPENISVTTVTMNEYGNVYLTTNLDIPVGSSWTWGDYYPSPDYDNPIIVEFDFQNIPDHSGYSLSSLFSFSSSSYALYSPFSFYFYQAPMDIYIKLNVTDSGTKYLWVNDITDGIYQVDLSTLTNTESQTIDLQGNSVGFRKYLYGYPTSGSRNTGRYRLDSESDYELITSSLNVYYPSSTFTDYKTSLYFFDSDNPWSVFWYQSTYGDIPNSFDKIDADFDFISTSPNDFQISITSTNFDEIHSDWRYDDDERNYYGDVYGPTDLTNYSLPNLPNSVLEQYPGLVVSLFELYYTDLIEHSELNSYEEILDIYFNSSDYFYNVVNDFRTRVKYPESGRSSNMMDDYEKDVEYFRRNNHR